MILRYYNESTDLSSGRNLQMINGMYHMPGDQEGVVVFLVSGSFEYDLELIKKMPPPRTNFKYVMIPSQLRSKIGTTMFTYQISNSEYNKHVEYLKKQKMVPQLKVINSAKKIGTENVYICMSDVLHHLNQVVRGLSPEYIEKHVNVIMQSVMNMFVTNQVKKKLWVVNTDRFKIYDGEDRSAMKSDIINGLIGSYLNHNFPKMYGDTTFIFRSSDGDCKMDMQSMNNSDIDHLDGMCKSIGHPFRGTSATVSTKESDLDEMLDDLNADKTETDENTEARTSAGGSGSKLSESIRALREKLGGGKSDGKPQDTLYQAKTFQINASLIHRINPDSSTISDYKRIANDLTPGGDHPVEDEIIDQASKDLANSRAAADETSVMNTTTSARELQLRSNIGQIRVKSLDTSAMGTVTDIPKPPPVRPIKITTTNPGSQQGTSFPNLAEEYESKMMDQDIVAAVMSLQKLPDGFTIEDIEVTDASSSVSLMHNWKISLKNKSTGSKSHINIYVPILKNGRFYYNGNYFNIGKQDFPIPILKLNEKRVMMTSNYNKIDVIRYDTKSLVDVRMMLKAVASQNKPDGSNPYVRYGSSVRSNSRFISTIEYDEYAKHWFQFENTERKARIVFNREQCLREFDFVTVDENEFCCGMVDQVPIILNTESGLDRHNRTISELLLTLITPEMQKVYAKTKPAKLSMYANIRIGVLIPLGVAIAAWEGLPSLLKRSGAQYRYVSDKEDTPGFLRIPFKDKTLAIQNTIKNQLIFNGFYRLNTKEYNTTDFESTVMDSNSIFIDILNQLFFKQYSQLSLFKTMYHFFVDAITEDVCQHYHLPTNICDMLIYAATLLSDNNFTSENNAALYRIRSSEIIPAIIHSQIAEAVSKYNNRVGSKTRHDKLEWNPNSLILQLINIETVSPISELNPMVELHEREILTKKGFHGMNSDPAYTQPKRSYEESMIGKIALSSPNNRSVGVNRQVVVDPKIESVRGYTSTAGVDTDFNDLQLASFSELLTPGTVTRDNPIRTAIATSQTSHILPTAEAEPVLISNGIDEIAPSYLSSEFAVTAKEDGKVLEIADGYMIIQYQSGKKQAIPVMDRYSFNVGSGFYVDNKLKSNFEPNDTFEKNDILAYHEKFFSKNSDGVVRMNIGPIAKVAFCGIYSTYEDAGLITEKMSKRLSSAVTMQQSSKLDATDDVESIVKVGDEVEIGDPLIVFGLGDTGDKAVDNFLKAFQSTDNILDTAKRVIRSKHAGRVVDVRMYTNKSMDKLSPSLFELLDTQFKQNIQRRKILDKYDNSTSTYKLDTIYSLPTQPLKTPNIKGISCDVLIEIYIEHSDDVSVGDKCVVYAASKQVISEVVPVGQEPYAESTPNEEISMFVSPSSILRRMLPSMMMTSGANKVLVELKKRIRDIWEK